MDSITVIWSAAHPEAHLAGQEPLRLNAPSDFGTHGDIASERPMFYDETAVPIKAHSLVGTSFTESNILKVHDHTGRFGHHSSNEKMIARLNRIATGDLEPTDYDARFYTHELMEYKRYIARDWQTSQPDDHDEAHRLWNTEHTCTLEDYGIHEKRFPLYHPETIDDSFY